MTFVPYLSNLIGKGKGKGEDILKTGLGTVIHQITVSNDMYSICNGWYTLATSLLLPTPATYGFLVKVYTVTQHKQDQDQDQEYRSDA